MPVKEYKTRYVVFETNDYEALIKTLRNAQNMQPSFSFKIVRNYNKVIVVKCPHKAVPILRMTLESLTRNHPLLRLKIRGVSGTLRKAVSKFCTPEIRQGKDYKASDYI
ncbi:MAG: hypothetical protein QXT26_00205 [Thermoproteota archaeon]